MPFHFHIDNLREYVLQAYKKKVDGTLGQWLRANADCSSKPRNLDGLGSDFNESAGGMEA